MKIMKRNGSEAAFDREKIAAAVTKANLATDQPPELSGGQVAQLALSVEQAAARMGRTLSVEEIQELVETEIMRLGAFETAKRYIRYRYIRSLARAANTTDSQILTLIECNNEEAKQENANKNPVVNSVQRDYMAGEVSKDITQRLLLPPDIVEAHKAGIIHFHDMDYYAQHMHNCDLVNLEDMLQNGTVISGTLIEKPHSFSTACNIATQIIAQVASNQYGGQSISLAHLAPFVQVSRERNPRAGAGGDRRRGRHPLGGGALRHRGEAPAGGDPPWGADHPVPGGHPHDHQRTGPLRHRVHVPGRGRRSPDQAGSGPHHRGDPGTAL